MAGHSKWSKVKHIKGPLDVKRGAASSKLVKEITVAARPGGGELSGNPLLRPVVETARAAHVPGDNSGRASKKGTGEIEGIHYEETFYEGYAPGGVARLIGAATDHRNRTAADLRFILSKNHGSFAADSQKHACPPDNAVAVMDEDAAARILRLYEALEDSEDTRNVCSSFEFPEETLSRLAA